MLLPALWKARTGVDVLDEATSLCGPVDNHIRAVPARTCMRRRTAEGRFQGATQGAKRSIIQDRIAAWTILQAKCALQYLPAFLGAAALAFVPSVHERAFLRRMIDDNNVHGCCQGERHQEYGNHCKEYRCLQKSDLFHPIYLEVFLSSTNNHGAPRDRILTQHAGRCLL
jgi:hypothetical protein